MVIIGQNKTSTKIYGYGGTKELINITSDDVSISNFLINYEFLQSVESYTYLLNLFHVNNVSITSNNFKSNIEWGDLWAYILVDFSYNCYIDNNDFNGSSPEIGGYNVWGIRLSESYNNIISNNIITYYWESGILLSNSNNNIISNNSIKYTRWGLILDYSNYNNIKGNIISHNEFEGIQLFKSSYNIIQKNQISYNNGTGLYIFEGSYNNITNNDISSNTFYGIEIISNSFIWNFISPDLNRTSSLYNIIAYNNFIDNGENAFFVSSFFTSWKMNYWGESIEHPHPIFGKIGPFSIIASLWINFDWNPAQEPYDISS